MTVKFKNVLVLPKDSVGYAVAAAQVGFVLDGAAAKPAAPAAPGAPGAGAVKPAAPVAPPSSPVILLPGDVAGSWVQSIEATAADR